MTFGSTLRELTNLCGVKRCNLAAALGYDPSYVSRWINDVKLPANTEHNPLLRNIAAYLTANATLEAREKIACRFSLDLPSPDDGQFSQSLEDLLAEAYRNTQAASPQTPQKTGRENAVLFRAKDAGAIPESIFDVLRSGAALEPRVDMLCTMPIHTQFKNNEPFFRRIRAMLPADTDIHITQFVDMNDLAGSVDASCRSFCYLMGAPHGIQYDFYELTPHRKNYGMTYLILDGVLLQYLRSPFSKDLLLLETTDAELIARYCSEANNYIMNRPAINARPELEKLLKNQYFLEYFMQPRCRCLLKRMQPLFFPEELQRRFLAREQTRGRQMGLFLDGSRFFESMILFKSAFVDYIYTGRLMAFGHTFVIPRKDRLAHLLVPRLGLAFLTAAALPVPGTPYRRLRLDAAADGEVLRRSRPRLRFAKKVSAALVEEAVSSLALAKAMHDDLEAIYNPHVDFDLVDEIAHDVWSEILTF